MECIVDLVANFEGVNGDSRGYYRVGGCEVQTTGVFHRQDALFNYSGNCASPPGMYGCHRAARRIVQQHGDAVGGGNSYADAFFAGEECVYRVQALDTGRAVESPVRFGRSTPEGYPVAWS